MADFDFSDIMKLAADLDSVADGIEGPLKKALNVTSMGVKKSAQAKVRGRKGLGHAASGITFDVKETAGGVESEIGYDKARGGAALLGNLVEFGAPGSPNALTPGNELQSSLQENEADFVRGVLRAVDDAQRKAGL